MMVESRCGINCSKCEYKEKVNCGGCTKIDKPFWGELCEVKVCCESRGREHCGQCPDFPCKVLTDFSYDKEQGDNGKRIENCRSWTNKQSLIDFCLTLPATYEDYPFDETTTLIRHSHNKKMFALIDHLHGELHVTMKCEPLKADFLRNAFESVVPGYHMNKEHWNTVYVDGDVSFDELQDMIRHSYDLIKPKPKKRKNAD